jgi:hypothetical protein
MDGSDGTVLWKTWSGLRCVLVPYDEGRYQLRLVREFGTVKTDLFPGYRQALAAAHEWLEQLDRQHIQQRAFVERRRNVRSEVDPLLNESP